MYNFINELTKNGKWDLTVLPAMSNLIELITSKNLFITMLVVDGEIVSAYIFKKTCTFLEKDKEIISCIASLNDFNSLSKEEFILGFKVSLWSILEKNKFSYLVVEDTSDNNHIIQNISIKTHPLAVSPTAYFFYNFAHNPFKSNKILMIN